MYEGCLNCYLVFAGNAILKKINNMTKDTFVE